MSSFIKYEQNVGSVLSRILQTELRHGGGPGDGGVDWFGVVSGWLRTIVQCKASHRPLPIKDIREFEAVVAGEKKSGEVLGILVSSSPLSRIALQHVISSDEALVSMRMAPSGEVNGVVVNVPAQKLVPENVFTSLQSLDAER